MFLERPSRIRNLFQAELVKERLDLLLNRRGEFKTKTLKNVKNVWTVLGCLPERFEAFKATEIPPAAFLIST